MRILNHDKRHKLGSKTLLYLTRHSGSDSQTGCSLHREIYRANIFLSSPCLEYSMDEIIAFNGYLGQRNIGDEAIYDATELLFENYQLIDYQYCENPDLVLYGGGNITASQS